MHNGKIEIGIVGTGWISTNAHIPALMKNDNVVVKAVYDTCLERAKEVCDEFKIPYMFHEYEPFLECGLDGIIIATPNYTHVPYTLAALEHKVSVLCEKPIAFHTNEVVEVKKLAEANEVLYVPGFVNRWRKDIQTLYQMIKDNQFGEILQVNGGWIRKCGVPRPGTWFTKREYSGGGVLIDLGSHVVDICNLFLGSHDVADDYQLTTGLCTDEKLKHSGFAKWFERKGEKEFAMDVEDNIIAKVHYPDNKKIQVNLSWLAPVEADCTYFKVTGTKGEAILKTLFGFSNERLWDKDTLEYELDEKKNVMEFLASENHSKYAFSDMLSYFVDLLLEEKTGFDKYEDAYSTVNLIQNLYKNEVVDEKTFHRVVMEEI
ncbi:MAG: Gfo/Idh/MocA family oxidoreductase [Lachnospiraceae bacterium]|nr:Gfo/Idh/MocA family oxidoreductase [Lachnospiraceae bacterium]